MRDAGQIIDADGDKGAGEKGGFAADRIGVVISIDDLRKIFIGLDVVMRDAIAIRIHFTELPARQRLAAGRRIFEGLERRMLIAQRNPSSPACNAACGFLKLRNGALSLATASAPSKACEGMTRSAANPMPAMAEERLNIGIGLGLAEAARMRHGAIDGGADDLRIFPEGAGTEIRLTRLPCLAAFGEFCIRHMQIDRAFDGVDDDDVAVLAARPIGPPTAASGPTWPTQKPRVPPEKRPSVISATFSPTPCPYSAAVVDSISRMPGPPLRPFVADDQDVAFLVVAVLHGGEAILLAIEAARRPAMTR